MVEERLANQEEFQQGLIIGLIVGAYIQQMFSDALGQPPFEDEDIVEKVQSKVETMLAEKDIPLFPKGIHDQETVFQVVDHWIGGLAYAGLLPPV